jgi:opacity protein-like surface antigen
MKKALAVCCVLALLATVSTSAFAERFGAPGASLAKGQSSVGLEYNYIESRVDFDTPNATIPFPPGINGEKQVNRQQLLVRVGYGLTDQLEAFVKMGGTSTNVKNAFLGTTMGLSHDIVGTPEFTIAGGLDATLIQSGDFRLGANGQISHFTLQDTDEFLGLVQSIEGDVTTLEGALLASYKLGQFTPYGGVCMFFSHSDNRYEAYTPGATPIWVRDVNADQEEWFGGVCGVKCAVTSNVNVGIELTGVAEGVGLSTGVTVAL